ncbi:uncharacterized protein LOC144619271 [Crassostrea virginica]
MSVSKINGVLLLYIGFYCIGRSQERYCKRNPYGCCEFTKWDPEESKCVECKAGYYWTNCNRTCPYPYYGGRCLQTCNCSEEVCNFITGCTEGDENPETTSTYINNAGNKQSTTKSTSIVKEPDLKTVLVGSAIEHAIDTGDATPVNQKFQRTPTSFEGEEEKHLEKMLKADVIEPSMSEWASSPVLVRKKMVA